MVIESKTQGVSRDVLAIVAGLTIQDPRERPLERRQQADEQHARFADPTSDFLTLLNLWNYLEKQQRELGSSAFRRLCKNEYLNYVRVREWNDVYRQLRQLAKPLGLSVQDGGRDTRPSSRARRTPTASTGRCSRAALPHRAEGSGPGREGERPARLEGGGIRPPRQGRVHRRPTGPLRDLPRLGAGQEAAGRRDERRARGDQPTLRPHQRGDRPGVGRAARRRPLQAQLLRAALVEDAGLRRRLREGHPLRRADRAAAARAVRPIDPHYARELFIRHALVEGEWDSSRLERRAHRVRPRQQRLRAELEKLEERTRRRDILVDDEAVFEFYHRRIPAEMHSTRSFETWWRSAHKETPDLLTMTAEALVPEDVASEADSTLFPPSWRQGDQVFTLRVPVRARCSG